MYAVSLPCHSAWKHYVERQWCTCVLQIKFVIWTVENEVSCVTLLYGSHFNVQFG